MNVLRMILCSLSVIFIISYLLAMQICNLENVEQPSGVQWSQVSFQNGFIWWRLIILDNICKSLLSQTKFELEQHNNRFSAKFASPRQNIKILPNCLSYHFSVDHLCLLETSKKHFQVGIEKYTCEIDWNIVIIKTRWKKMVVKIQHLKKHTRFIIW